MFIELLAFEIKLRLWRLSSLVYFLVYLLLGFIISIAIAGVLPGGHIALGASGKLCLNSSYAIHQLVAFGGYLGLLIIAPIFGQSINKDFEKRFNQILFATPLRKSTYFLVRYFASVISSVVILSSIAIGIFIATLLPFIDRAMICRNEIWYYVAPYLTEVIPNTMMFGAIFIAIASLTKRMAPVYLASIVVFTGWLIARTLSSSIGDHNIPALLDPLGQAAANLVTRYWSASEQATQTIPLTGMFLYNRILWASVGSVILLLAYVVFDPFKLPREKTIRTSEPEKQNEKTFAEINLPAVNLAPNSVFVLLELTLSEFKLAISNIHFQMVLLCGVIFVFATARFAGKAYGTETLPLTYNVLEVVNGMFGLFVAILTTFCSGELVWKERDSHIAELVDAKPIPNLYLYLSQLFTLFLIQILLACTVLICCVVVQITMGFFNFEWGVYFQQLFIFSLVQWLFLDVIALFVHIMSKRKYIGHSVLIFYFALMPSLKALGLDHHLYLIGDVPLADYSDMNGYGTSGYPFFIYSLYWAFYSLICGILTLLLWPRGVEQTYRGRLRIFGGRLTLRYKAGLIFSIAGFVVTGGFIFYNTNILNHYETKAEEEKERVDYEVKFKEFERIPQPELVAASIEADIYPETQSLKTRGHLTYRNRTKKPVTTILVHQDEELRAEKFTWSRSSKLKEHDLRLESKIYEFDTPILPGEEVSLDFSFIREPRGFSNAEFRKDVVQNGSFIYNGGLGPIVGYVPQVELTEDKTRRKYGLAKRLRKPNVNDRKALEKTYISNEGSWIDFEATVSTSADQIAIAPGTLIKEWKEGGRRFFRYRMSSPMIDYYAILSGRYKVARDKWHDVDIEIYYHPSHTYNIARMLKATKASLEYCSTNFSPYQFKQLRIVEFPRYKKEAQSFANMIPFSESAGFVANVKSNDPKSIDYPFYITSHEVAHQWWAHQVIGGNVQGATMLSESLAQYSALMVQEKEYGEQGMSEFLSYELDDYLSGRRTEEEMELPLVLNEGQDYIHYNKGSLVFYALKDYLSEKTLNGVLRDFIHEVGFQHAPFTRAVDLVDRFRRAAPTDKKYLIKDLFETITFYVMRCDSVSANSVGDHYDVVVRGNCRKFRVDGMGNGTEIPMNDLVDVGLNDKGGKYLYLKKHLLKSGNVEVHIPLSTYPAEGAFDPLNKLLRIRRNGFVVKEPSTK